MNQYYQYINHILAIYVSTMFQPSLSFHRLSIVTGIPRRCARRSFRSWSMRRLNWAPPGAAVSKAVARGRNGRDQKMWGLMVTDRLMGKKNVQLRQAAPASDFSIIRFFPIRVQNIPEVIRTFFFSIILGGGHYFHN